MNQKNPNPVEYRTEGKGIRLDVTLKVIKPCTVTVSVWDPKAFYTVFYQKQYEVTHAPETFRDEITIPITNEVTALLVSVDKPGDLSDYVLRKVEAHEYSRPDPGFTGKEEEFVKFFEEWAMQAGYLPANHNYTHTYMGKDGKEEKFVISYLPVILRPDGSEHSTPARISADGTNFIEVSKKHMMKCTVPRRIAIGLHEFSHNNKNANPDDEEEADKWAEYMYEKMSWPKIEFFYAFSKMFRNYTSEELVERLKDPRFRDAYEVNVRRLEKVKENLSRESIL